jgi:hypothetical protein
VHLVKLVHYAGPQESGSVGGEAGGCVFDRQFYREIRTWFVALSKFRRYGLFISSIAVPTMLGILTATGGWSADLKAQLVPVQIAVIVLGLLIGVGLFWFDEHPALIFQKFALETQRSSELQGEIDRQRVELIQLSSHINCLGVAARAVESALLVAEPTTNGLQDIAKGLLEEVADRDLFTRSRSTDLLTLPAQLRAAWRCASVMADRKRACRSGVPA